MPQNSPIKPAGVQTDADNATKPGKLHRIIGLQIEAARLEQAMSLDTLAKLLDLPPGQLIAIERGDLRINPVQLYEVAQHCQKPLSFFFPFAASGTTVIH